jgi:hypothetical protein
MVMVECPCEDGNFQIVILEKHRRDENCLVGFVGVLVEVGVDVVDVLDWGSRVGVDYC